MKQSAEKRRNNVRTLLIMSISIIIITMMAFVGLSIYNKVDYTAIRDNALRELAKNEGEYDPQSIVLQDTTKAEASAFAQKLDATVRTSPDGKYAALTLPSGLTVTDVYNDDSNEKYFSKISADYRVSTKELDEGTSSLREPIKPRVTFNDTYFEQQSYYDYLNMSTVWNTTKGSGITVAVIDTGIDTDHSEFSGRISDYSYNASEDKIVRDYDNDWSLIEDEVGHGTAVAGTIGAAANGTGTVGIAPQVTLLIIKCDCDSLGRFSRASDLVFGLYYAIERDVDVVNMSFGMQSSENPFAQATQLAVDSDIICVAAAGNSATPATHFPAADPNVISVGALADNSWELATYSNYGENVNIVAPGTVYTCKMGNAYQTINGTSFAAPITAGVIALYLSQNKYSTFKEVQEVLYASCYDLGDLGEDWYYGYGALDVSALILEDKGTITFDMLTNELDNTTQKFVRNHTLQNIPEPERLYAVFDGWYYDQHCTEEYNYYQDIFVSDITLYAHWVNEEDGIPFTYTTLEDDTIEIRSYTGKRKFISVPEMIDGKPVTSIGDSAFANKRNLREVGLPQTLTKIKRNAFSCCSNLMHIDIPQGVTMLGDSAFRNNVRLSYVSFADNAIVSTIGHYAFSGCSKLSEFTIPASVKSVDGSAFCGATSITKFSIKLGNTAFSVKDGVLFNKTGRNIVAFPAGKRGTYTVPSNVTTIDILAFAYTRLTTVNLLNVSTIEPQAFAYSMLESLTIPDSVREMDEGAFVYNYYLSSVSLGSGLTEISELAFTCALSLESIIIPSNIINIKSNAFAGSALIQLSFAENSNLLLIGPSSFAATMLGFFGDSVTLPASVQYIGDGAFACNIYLSDFFIEEGSNLKCIGKNSFERCYSLSSFAFPESLEEIRDNAFSYTHISEVNLSANVKTIGEGVFSFCHSLPAINIDGNNPNYTSVNGVLYNKDKTTLIEYPAGKIAISYSIDDSTKNIAGRAFQGADNLMSINLSNVEKISSYALANVSLLRSLNIPNTVTEIGVFAFKEDYKLKTITFGEDSPLLRIPYGTFAYCGLTSFTVPKNVSTIAQGAFLGCPNLQTMTFAENSKLSSVSAYMFKGCTSLTTITFLSGSALTSIQAHGFEGMSKLIAVNFNGAGLVNIDNFAFRSCESLTRFDVPTGVNYIGRYAFYYCIALEDVLIPSTVEYIGANAFLGDKKANIYFESPTLPTYLAQDWDSDIRGYYLGVQEVLTEGDYKYATLISGDFAVIQYNGTATIVDLTALTYGDRIVNIGGGAFAYSSVERIVLPETVMTIQSKAFYNSPLLEINMPVNVAFIGRQAFASTQLETVTFPSNSRLVVIEQSAFEATKQLNSVSLPASLERMGRAVFRKSTLASITFADGSKLTEIPEECFAESSITSIAIPAGVATIGDGAFRATKSLASVAWNEQELMIRSNAFYQSGLTSLDIPETITHIGEYAFVSLEELTSITVDSDNPYYESIDGLLVTKTGRKLITVPAGRTGSLNVPIEIEEIGFGAFEASHLSNIVFDENCNVLSFGCRAFYGANSITSINIPASVVAIDYYAFATCKNLETVTFSEGSRLKGVYEGAFYLCGKLKNITLPDSIIEISDYAFYGDTALTYVPVDENTELKGIYNYAMAYTGITELNIPETLIDIGEYAFMGIKIKTLTIPETNKHDLVIGIGAFEDCNELEELSLPFIGASYEDERCSWLGYIFGAGNFTANEVYVPDSIKTVTITEGLTTIGRGAFNEITTIERINLPNTIQYVFDYAFYYCSAEYELTNAITPKLFRFGNVVETKKITEEYFKNSGIRILSISENVKYFEGWIFDDCSRLNSVYYSGDIASWCAISFYVPQSNPLYRAQNLYINNELVTDLIIPDTVTSIGNNTFCWATCIQSVTISDSVIYIGNCAFYQCRKLKNVIIGENVQIIGDLAFAECIFSNLIIPDSVKQIGDFAFISCNRITNVVLPEGIEYINNGWFMNDSSIISIVIPPNVKYIADGTFVQCNRIEIIYNNSDLVFEFGSSAHGAIAYYAKIIIDKYGNKTYIDDGNEYIETAEGFLFHHSADSYQLVAYLGVDETVVLPTDIKGYPYGIYRLSGVKNVIIPDGITVINDSAFYYCRSLESIVIPTSVSMIGKEAFRGCLELKSITIPDSVIYFGENAFYDCGLSYVNYEGNIATWCSIMFLNEYANPMYRTHELRINDEVLSEIIIPDSVSEIKDYAFYSVLSLKSVRISENVEKISKTAFIYCRDLTITFDENNQFFTVIDGVIYDKQVTQIVYVPDTITKIDVPKTVTSIILRGNENIEKIIFAEDALITTIEKEAFRDCIKLQSITLPSSITQINFQAFCGCDNLSSVIYYGDVYDWCRISFDISSVTSNPLCYAGNLYINNELIKEIVVPTWSSIRPHTFAGWNGNKITIPNTIKSIGYEAFSDCKYLTKVEYMGTIEEWCQISFYNGFSNPLYYAHNLYIDNELVEDLIIPGTVTELKDYAFYGWNGKSLEIESGLNVIGMYAFSDCKELRNVIINDGVTIIQQSVFSNCSNLLNITLSDSITEIKYGTFWQCSNLTSFTIPKNVTNIVDTAFYGCQNLVLIYNNSDLELSFKSNSNGYIAQNAKVIVDKNGNRSYYSNKYTMTDDGFLLYKESIYSDYYYLLGYWGEETTLILPEKFNDMNYIIGKLITGATNIIIPNTVMAISDSAFYGCGSLLNIEIPDSITYIGIDAFTGTGDYNDVGNWQDGFLYLDDWLIEVPDDCVYFEVNPDIRGVEQAAYRSHYVLKKAFTKGNAQYVFKDATNLVTLVVMDIPTTSDRISSYFRESPLWAAELPLTLKNIVLSSGIRMYDDAFRDITGITIWVEDEEAAVKWDDNYPGWNNGNKVIYGDKWIWADYYDKDGNLISSEPYQSTEMVKQPYIGTTMDDTYGYEFVGWDIDNDGIADTIPATSVVDIKAKAVVRRYYLTYSVSFVDHDGTVIEQNDVIRDEVLILPDEPTRKGYTFVGWSGYVFGVIASSDVIFVAIWEHEGSGHIYDSTTVVPPTCTEKGYTKHICSICDEWYATDYVDASGHEYGSVIVAPTCIERGYTGHICSVCGDNYKDNFTDAIGHTFGDWIIFIAATCEEQGVRRKTCTACGSSIEEIIDLIGHEYVSQIKKAASCTQEGVIEYTCMHCGDTVTENIPVEPHSYQKKQASRTFLGWLLELFRNFFYGYDGNRTYYYECSQCGHIMTADEMEKSVGTMSAHEHTLGEWEVRIEESCLEQGIEVQCCTECKLIVNLRTFGAPLGHDIVHHDAKVPTCTENGWNAYDTCSRCDYTTYAEIAALGHDYVNDVCDMCGLRKGWDLAFEYDSVNDGYVVTGIGSCIDTDILIPSLYNDKPVIGIQDSAFSSMGFKSVVIENGITYIGTSAFSGCGELISIIVPKSVTSIGEGAFSGCSSMQKITIPFVGAEAGKTSKDTYQYPFGFIFGTSSYTGGTSTVQQYYGSSTSSTTSSTYYIPASLRSVTITGGDIPYGAFYNCSNLTNVAIGSGAMSIGGSAFYNCNNLTNISIPNSVTSIGNNTFWGCSNLVSITFDNNSQLKSIGNTAFYGCSNLQIITIPDSVTNIGRLSFIGCTSLASIVVPNSVTDIEVSLFYGCSSLQIITIPDSVTSIGNNAFYSCSSLTTIVYVGTKGQWELVQKGNNWDANTGDYTIVYHTDHIAGDLLKTVEPTCSEQGYSVYVCSQCQLRYKSDYVNALGHNLIYHDAQVPTCTEIGWNAYDTCSRCDYTTYEELNALGHNLVHHDAQAPTCTEIGWDAYDTCSRCNHTTYEEIPALGHNYQAVVISPTCTDQGFTTHTCSHCQDSYVDTYVDELGHNLIHHDAKASTCTEIGWNEYDACLRCDYTTFEGLPVLGHDLIQHDAKEPTCTESGWDAYDTCSRCNYTTYEELSALGHNYQAIVTAPTCTMQGYTTHVCSRCEDSYVDTYVEKLGHNYQAIVTAPTCIAQGYTTHTCSRCGDSYIDNYVDALGHDIVSHVAKAATCTTIGWNIYNTCTRCDYTTYEGIAPLGHDLVHHDEKAPTCTDVGWHAYDTCTRCNYSTYEEIVALGHNYVDTVTAPTCTTQGYTMHVCSRCTCEYIDSYVNALGHSIVSHKAKAPTCTEIGWNEYDTCSRCDFSTYEALAALGHEYQVYVTNPTCLEQGYTTHTCSRCQDSYVDTYVNSLGHDIVSHKAKAPTCTEIGWNEYDTCSRCEYTTYEEVAVLGHNMVHYDAKDPTCTDVGWNEYDACSRCDLTMYEEIPALGHDLIHHDAKEATCTEIGWDAYNTCSRCEYSSYAELSVLGHHYGEVVTDPTCTEEGFTTHTCERCGDSYADSIVNAFGHDYIATITEPTCTEKGCTIHTCSRCDDAYQDEWTDALGHEYLSEGCTQVIEPTCEERGYTIYTCGRCGITHKGSYVEETGHSFGEWIIVTTPTASEMGTKSHVCSVCQKEETEEFGFSEIGQSFVDSFNSINFDENKVRSSNYYAICQAIDSYNELSETEKEWLSEDYKTLVSYVRQYNEIAERVNDDIDTASKNSFSLFSLLSSILSAIWYALKNLF